MASGVLSRSFGGLPSPHVAKGTRRPLEKHPLLGRPLPDVDLGGSSPYLTNGYAASNLASLELLILSLGNWLTVELLIATTIITDRFCLYSNGSCCCFFCEIKNTISSTLHSE